MTTRAETLPREVELALVVRSDTPEPVLRRITQLEAIDGFALLPRPPQGLRDRYLDTERGDLGSRRYALRIREVDGEPRITLKGEPKRLASGTDRLELELPWSPDAAACVLAELHRRGLPVGIATAPGNEPIDALAGAGLRLIQERETRREVRSVVNHAGEELAELDVDAVTYRFRDGEARLHEVEIEARSPTADLALIAGALRRSAPELVDWPHGKLVTGSALERTLAAGTIRLGPDRAVTAEVLDRLSTTLAASD